MKNGTIDLRSDTVTKPTDAMWDAMHRCEVGDDVFGEDPNINALQEEAAALLGTQAALFVPSGTMANQIALRAHTQSGDEVVAHPRSHLVRLESAGSAALAGVQFSLVGDPDGGIQPEDVEAVIQDGTDPHYAPTTLICMENTHANSGGRALPLEMLEGMARVAARHGIRMHMDGARLLNACVALDVQAEAITRHFDSVTLCLSKGLGAPVGSVVAGTREFMVRCNRFRKMYGGAMRQAGPLAAAGRHAIAHQVQRMAEDHDHARLLADGLEAIAGIALPRGRPQTNMVYIASDHPRIGTDALVAGLRERGILVLPAADGVARAVTHLDVNRADVEQTVAITRELLGA